MEKYVGNSVFAFVQKRRRSEMAFPNKLLKPHVTRKLPEIFCAKDYNMGSIDKIFASHWLDCKNIVYDFREIYLSVLYHIKILLTENKVCMEKISEQGFDSTNQATVELCILNVLTGKSTVIPMVEGPTPPDAENNCGIHSVEMNPSCTMLATGGESPNDLSVYKLPEFEPICLGLGHSDWIFSIAWLNEHVVVTGSRDGSLGVWNTKHCGSCFGNNPAVCIKEPSSQLKSIYSDEKVRAIQYNSFSMELASLSTKAQLHIWDVNKLKTISSVELPYQQENVCLSLEPGNSLYAVGSQSHVTLLDGRCPSKELFSVESVDNHAGIRSLSFHNKVVTIGTGFGSCSFLDLRTYNFLHNTNGSICLLKAGEGWLRRDEVYYTLFGEMCFPNAIYTHCYDPTGTKLFTGGGPLAVGLYGNYAALWQ